MFGRQGSKIAIFFIVYLQVLNCYILNYKYIVIITHNKYFIIFYKSIWITLFYAEYFSGMASYSNIIYIKFMKNFLDKTTKNPPRFRGGFPIGISSKLEVIL